MSDRLQQIQRRVVAWTSGFYAEDVGYLLAQIEAAEQRVGELEAELSAVRHALKSYEEKELGTRGEARCYPLVSGPLQPSDGDK